MQKIQHGSKTFWLTNLALFSAGFVTFANLYMTQALLPIFTEQFHISPTVASLSLSGTTLTLAFSLLIFGSLSEAWGRKRLMSISIVIASALTIVIAFTTTFETLLTLRILQGFIFAGVPAIAMAYLAEEMDSRSLSAAMGLYISGNSIGGLGGRVIIGTLTDHFGWQIAMITLGSLSLLISLYFIIALPPSKYFEAKPLRLSSLSYSLWQHLKNPILLSLFFIGFALMGGFVTFYNYIGFKLLAPPYSLSTTIVSSLFLVYLVGTFSSTWFGSLDGKRGRLTMLVSGIALMLIGCLVTLAMPLALKMLGMIIFTFGFFGAHAIASGAVSANATTDRAQASSLYLFAYYGGSSIGGTTGGLFWTNWGWSGIVCFISALLVASFVAVRTIYQQTTKKPN